MKTSINGINQIETLEELRLKAYLDPLGIPTIGYGHTGPDVHLGQVITKLQAEQLLQKDLAVAEGWVNAAVKVPLNQNQFDALVSIVFNVGHGSSKKDGIIQLTNGKPSSLLRLLNLGNYALAADEFSKWVYGGGQKLPGLVTRRAMERALFLKPVVAIRS